jgi:hypothetical protein
MNNRYKSFKKGLEDLSNKEIRDKHERELLKPEVLRKNIEELEKLDLSTITDDALSKLIDEKIGIIGFASHIYSAGNEIFRARINEGGKPFQKVSEIGAPATKYITKYGRANKPGERIFYGAYSLFIALGELVLNPKTIEDHNGTINLTVGKYIVMENLHLVSILHDKKLQEARMDIKKQAESLPKHRHQYSNSSNESRDLIIEFFAKQFTKRNILSPSDYKISCLYMNKVKWANNQILQRDGNQKFDGINYPSVASKFKGDNVALFTELAKRKLKIVGAYHVECSNINVEKCEFTVKTKFHARGMKDGVLMWDYENYIGHEEEPAENPHYKFPNSH